VTPIKYSRAAGSGLFMYDLTNTEVYMDVIPATRKHCDESNELHCWMTGIAYSFWEQYLHIEQWLFEISLFAVLIGFGVSTSFYFFDMTSGGSVVPGRSLLTKLRLSVSAGLVVACVSALSVFTVIGLAALSDVNLSGFSAMSYLMSAAFAVEYAVHVSHRFMSFPHGAGTSLDRAVHAMTNLFVPATFAFISSAVGILCLGFSKFEFVHKYFFTPLMIVLFATYFYGVFLLPVLFALFGPDSSAAESADGGGGKKNDDPAAPTSPLYGKGTPDSSLPVEAPAIIDI